MPLVLEPPSAPEALLQELRSSLHKDLEETVELVRQPPGQVLDPASLSTAMELLRSTLAVLDAPGPRSQETLVAEVNLAYASLVSAIDLVKSHTDVPRVPRKRT